jgi:hypothetical protein
MIYSGLLSRLSGLSCGNKGWKPERTHVLSHTTTTTPPPGWPPTWERFGSSTPPATTHGDTTAVSATKYRSPEQRLLPVLASWEAACCPCSHRRPNEASGLGPARMLLVAAGVPLRERDVESLDGAGLLVFPLRGVLMAPAGQQFLDRRCGRRCPPLVEAVARPEAA